MVPLPRPLWQGCLAFTPLANRPAGYLQSHRFTAAAAAATSDTDEELPGAIFSEAPRSRMFSHQFNIILKALIPYEYEVFQVFCCCYFENILFYFLKWHKMKVFFIFLLS